MDIPNYIKHCYETNQLSEIGNLFNYIKDRLFITQNDTSYNHLRFSFSDSTAFDDIEFRKRFLIDMKDSDLKKYLMKRFDAIYENSSIPPKNLNSSPEDSQLGSGQVPRDISLTLQRLDTVEQR
jgi:predicted metal-dependent hydrolase